MGHAAVARTTIAKRNESVPNVIVNDAIDLFFKLQPAFCEFQTVTVSECCLTKLLPCISFEKYNFIFQRWKWPAQGAGTVPVVSAHFRSLYKHTRAARRQCKGDDDDSLCGNLAPPPPQNTLTDRHQNLHRGCLPPSLQWKLQKSMKTDYVQIFYTHMHCK